MNSLTAAASLSSLKAPSGGVKSLALFWPTKKLWMGRATSVASPSFANRCANGCSASPLTPNGCCRTSILLTGPIHLRKCSAIGLAAAKALKLISRLLIRRRKLPFSRLAPIHFSVLHTWSYLLRAKLVDLIVGKEWPRGARSKIKGTELFGKEPATPIEAIKLYRGIRSR